LGARQHANCFACVGFEQAEPCPGALSYCFIWKLWRPEKGGSVWPKARPK
jgi:hypothetical protein